MIQKIHSLKQLSFLSVFRKADSNINAQTTVDINKHNLKDINSWKSIKESLIPDSLDQLENDQEYLKILKETQEKGQEGMTLQEKKNIRRSLDVYKIPNFWDYLQQNKLEIPRNPIEVFQMNIGIYCNQACNHCHVESSPKRKEMMSREVVDRCLELIGTSDNINTVDITGGAPELNKEFRYLVENVRKLYPNVKILDRCNLTVLSEPDQEDLVPFLKEHNVDVVASLPCYGPKNVNMQRGKGVFEKSIYGLQLLNQYGYGKEGGLDLHLVYNPIGPFLPPPQGDLQAAYKKQLKEDFGIEFHDLFTITNMPVKRYADFLYRRDELADYMNLIVNSFNADTLNGIMCRNYISISWDGKLYDCDFNQQLRMGLRDEKLQSVFDLKNLKELENVEIETGNHCYGCTAGQGSSCQGAL